MDEDGKEKSEKEPIIITPEIRRTVLDEADPVTLINALKASFEKQAAVYERIAAEADNDKSTLMYSKVYRNALVDLDKIVSGLGFKLNASMQGLYAGGGDKPKEAA